MPSPDTSKPKSRPNSTVLHFRGENVVSFKNSKLMARGRLITDPRKQKQMERIAQDFASQLLSLYQTSGGETGTGCSLQSWIASVMPWDDCRQAVPEISVSFREVAKGDEGCDVEITPLG